MVDICFSVLLFGHSVSDSTHTLFKLMTAVFQYLKYIQYYISVRMIERNSTKFSDSVFSLSYTGMYLL